jgi:hypothetical protein
MRNVNARNGRLEKREVMESFSLLFGILEGIKTMFSGNYTTGIHVGMGKEAPTVII